MAATVLVASSGFGCRGSDEPQSLARVGEWTLGVEEIQAEIERGEGRYSSYELRRALVERRVEHAVLAENAREAGYADRPEVKEAIERLLVSRFLEDELEQRLEGLDVTEAEVEAHYRANLARYTTPERVRTAAILVPVHPRATPESRASKREKIEAAWAAAEAERLAGTARRTFGALAVRYSEDRVSRYRGGDLGWVDRREAGSAAPAWNPALADAVLALSGPGELTPILETGAGFAIAKRLEHRPETTKPLVDVRDEIRGRLLREKRQAAHEAFLAEMYARVDVEVHEDVLRSLDPPAAPARERAPPRPPSMPGGFGE